MTVAGLALDYWAHLEADFAQYYGVDDPLALPWRRFKVLVAGLPPGARVWTMFHDRTLGWKDRLDLQRGVRRRRSHVGFDSVPGGRVVRRGG